MSQQTDIERFDLLCAREVRPCLCTVVGVPDGGYVRWKDHQAAIEAKDAEIASMRKTTELLRTICESYQRLRFWKPAFLQGYNVDQLLLDETIREAEKLLGVNEMTREAGR